MNGSLPPSSRLTRAIRRAARSAIRVPVATLPVSDAVDALVVDQPLADVAASRQQRDEAAGQVVDARRESEGGQRRELGRLA